MDKREAKRLAYAVAHGLIDSALRDGGLLLDAVQDEYRLTDADVARVRAALDDVAQQMWERANPQRAS